MSTLKFDGQPMTKREILIARVAWDEGYDYGIGDRGTMQPGWRALSSGRYPLPKVTRPRIVRDPHDSGTVTPAWHWKVERNAVVLCEEDGAVLYPPCHPTRSAERVALWADLLANPTEEVEDDS